MPRKAEVGQQSIDPRKLSLILEHGGSGERPAEDSAVRNRVGDQDSIGPFAGSNPALGTTQALKDKYTASRNKYKPNKVNVLLIAESPPSSGGYFYSETTIGKDHLFRETMKALQFWPVDRPMRKGCDKQRMLKRFRSIGFFLIDTCELPVDKLQPRQRRISTIQAASTLPRRVRELNPTRILIVKKTVFKPARQSLIEAGLGDRILNTKTLSFPSHRHHRKILTMIHRIQDKEKLRKEE